MEEHGGHVVGKAHKAWTWQRLDLNLGHQLLRPNSLLLPSFALARPRKQALFKQALFSLEPAGVVWGTEVVWGLLGKPGTPTCLEAWAEVLSPRVYVRRSHVLRRQGADLEGVCLTGSWYLVTGSQRGREVCGLQHCSIAVGGPRSDENAAAIRFSVQVSSPHNTYLIGLSKDFYSRFASCELWSVPGSE